MVGSRWFGLVLFAAVVGSGCDDAADGAALAVADVAGADVAADSAAVARPDLTWDVTKAGPYHIGFRTWNHTYTPPGTTTPRTIVLSLWYPTEVASGPAGTYYGLFDDPLVVADAAPAPPVTDAGYPLHLYSHGHQGYGGSSPHLARHFASHGWVVVAPDHTGGTFSDGDARGPSIYWLKMADTTATLDALEQLASTDPLAGKIDTKHTLLSAHSFGCWNLFATAGAPLDPAIVAERCAGLAKPGDPCDQTTLSQWNRDWRDPRVVAAIPMASAPYDAEPFGATGLAKLAVPTLLMSGKADAGHDGAPIWAWLDGADASWIDVTDGCHQLFALGGCPDLPQAVGTPIVYTYALAFARAHVLADPSAAVQDILSGETVVSPLASFARKTQQ
jgi:predicted dienelactone hydrolase